MAGLPLFYPPHFSARLEDSNMNKMEEKIMTNLVSSKVDEKNARAANITDHADGELYPLSKAISQSIIGVGQSQADERRLEQEASNTNSNQPSDSPFLHKSDLSLPEYEKEKLFTRHQGQPYPLQSLSQEQGYYYPPPPYDPKWLSTSNVISPTPHQQQIFSLPSPSSLRMHMSPSPFTVDSRLSPISTPYPPPRFSGFRITGPDAIATTTAISTINKGAAKNKAPKIRKRTLKTTPSSAVLPLNAVTKHCNPLKGHTKWTNDETKILIEIYKIYAQELKHSRKLSTWELFKEQYDLRCKQENVNSIRDMKQIRCRIDYLVDTYNEIRNNTNLTCQGKTNFKWYDAMSGTLDYRSAVVPTDISELISLKMTLEKSKSMSLSSTISPNMAISTNVEAAGESNAKADTTDPLEWLATNQQVDVEPDANEQIFHT